MSNSPVSYRPNYEQTFEFPKPDERNPRVEDLQQLTGYKSVTIRELRKSDEAQALSLAGTDGAAVMQRMVAYSVVRAVRLDGTVLNVTSADDSIDRFFAEIGPKGRTLVAAAYNAVNQPRPDAAELFLKSASVSVQ